MINLNYEQMEKICTAPEKAFQHESATITQTTHGPLIYYDRGSTILAVAHLDSVQSTKHFYHLKIGSHDLVYNAQLDDRLGVYVIIGLLPSLKINTDILLTTGEETGHSTAQFFETTKKYKWMFQFDRHGDDVVTYQYTSKFLGDRLKRVGFRSGIGSFSDIGYLEHLGCEGFNIGCGYKDEHSIFAHADMQILIEQTEKFLKFFDKFKTLPFPSEPKKFTRTVYYPQIWTGSQGYDPDYYYNKATFGRVGDDVSFPKNNNTHKKAKQGRFKELPAQKKELCIKCYRPLWRYDLEADVIFPGLCLACSTSSQLCLGCAFPFPESKLDEKMLCPQCHASSLVGDILTRLICTACNRAHLMLSEVEKGLCITCLMDEPSHRNWRDLE